MSAARPAPIGVFDSGVGGLTVFRELARALPDASLVYLGDTARVPYGVRSAETIRSYTREAARFLTGHGVGRIVVACNSVSAVALDAMAEESGLPVTGVIEPGARRAVERAAGRPIGVIGTRATVGSGAYERAIRALHAAAVVTSRACPLFVPLAEEGWTDDDIAERVARRYLDPLREEGVGALVLGCTHYPLLRDVIGRVMGDGVALIDSAETVAADIAASHAADGFAPGDREHHFCVTDAPESFQTVAERFLGRPIRRLERVAL